MPEIRENWASQEGPIREGGFEVAPESPKGEKLVAGAVAELRKEEQGRASETNNWVGSGTGVLKGLLKGGVYLLKGVVAICLVGIAAIFKATEMGIDYKGTQEKMGNLFKKSKGGDKK